MNRLVEEASLYKGFLDRESASRRWSQRPLFIQGVQSVFLWRFFQFVRARRENNEMVKWIGNFSLLPKASTRCLDGFVADILRPKRADDHP